MHHSPAMPPSSVFTRKGSQKFWLCHLDLFKRTVYNLPRSVRGQSFRSSLVMQSDLQSFSATQVHCIFSLLVIGILRVKQRTPMSAGVAVRQALVRPEQRQRVRFVQSQEIWYYEANKAISEMEPALWRRASSDSVFPRDEHGTELWQPQHVCLLQV